MATPSLLETLFGCSIQLWARGSPGSSLDPGLVPTVFSANSRTSPIRSNIRETTSLHRCILTGWKHAQKAPRLPARTKENGRPVSPPAPPPTSAGLTLELVPEEVAPGLVVAARTWTWGCLRSTVSRQDKKTTWSILNLFERNSQRKGAYVASDDW